MANKIIIPQSFKLNNKVIEVEFDDEECNNINAYGFTDFDDGGIVLCQIYKGKKLSKHEVDKTFFHELVHKLLDSCNRHQLKYNEEFVEELAQRLYEFSRTAKY